MTYRQVRIITGKGPGAEQFRDELRGLAIASDRLFAVGDSKLCVFSLDGQLLKTWPTERPGFSVGVGPDGTIYVGQPSQVQTFDRDGQPLDTWRDADRFALVTAIAATSEDVFLADAGDRCIRRCDRQRNFVANIGKDSKMHGFVIPNRHLDFALDDSDILHVANPGLHRVERYTRDGKLLGHFGRFDGVDPAGFGGCCNPTNVALTRRGQIVVTEKAGPRVKIYDSAGNLQTLLGERDFDPACKNMDVAVDAQDRTYVIDTARLHILVFAPDEPTAPTTAPSEAMEKP